MNFYDMLRLLITKGAFREGQINDLLALIDYLEHMNAFGAVVQQKVSVHEHVFERLHYGMRACRVCGMAETRHHVQDGPRPVHRRGSDYDSSGGRMCWLCVH